MSLQVKDWVVYTEEKQQLGKWVSMPENVIGNHCLNTGITISQSYLVVSVSWFVSMITSYLRTVNLLTQISHT